MVAMAITGYGLWVGIFLGAGPVGVTLVPVLSATVVVAWLPSVRDAAEYLSLRHMVAGRRMAEATRAAEQQPGGRMTPAADRTWRDIGFSRLDVVPDPAKRATTDWELAGMAPHRRRRLIRQRPSASVVSGASARPTAPPAITSMG